MYGAHCSANGPTTPSGGLNETGEVNSSIPTGIKHSSQRYPPLSNRI